LTRINRPNESQHEDVDAAIGRIPILAEGAGAWAVLSLPSFTNRTYRIVRDGQAYVLRLPGRGTGRYIDRAAEAVNARAAASIGLSPEVVFADPPSGVMVSRYVDGAEPLSPSRLRQPGELLATVGLLKRLHGSGLLFQGEMRLYPKLDEYLGLAHAPALNSLRAEGERLRPILEAGWGPLRPCHIDPAPHNFIAAGSKRYLLDWEYAARCEPLWDLAGLSIEGEFDSDQDGQMLAAYFGKAEVTWRSRLHLYKIMLRLLAAAWGAVQLHDANGPLVEIADLVDRLTRRVQADLSAPDLGRHLQTS
jgi:thiamine kinase-like enzyme